jgi:hypothetical protein
MSLSQKVEAPRPNAWDIVAAVCNEQDNADLYARSHLITDAIQRELDRLYDENVRLKDAHEKQLCEERRVRESAELDAEIAKVLQQVSEHERKRKAL